MPEAELRHCVALALTYHLGKRKGAERSNCTVIALSNEAPSIRRPGLELRCALRIGGRTPRSSWKQVANAASSSLTSLAYWVPAFAGTTDVFVLAPNAVSVLATHCARALPETSRPRMRGRREDRVRAAPAVPCAVCTKKCCTRAYRAAVNTRPSLRNGFTAYAVISPETSSWLTPSLPFRFRLPDSLTPATGARTTRFCRTPIHAIVEA